MYINIQGLPVELSEETIKAFKAHADFCSNGTKWLVSNDPKSKLETPLINAVDDCIRRDCVAALENLTRLLQAACTSDIDYFNLNKDDYWEQLENLLGSTH